MSALCPRWSSADDRFSRMASELRANLVVSQRVFQEIDLLVISPEAKVFIGRQMRFLIAPVLRRYGFTPWSFFDELEARVGPKGAYQSGLDVRGFFPDYQSFFGG